MQKAATELEQQLKTFEERLLEIQRRLGQIYTPTPREPAFDDFPLPDIIISGPNWQATTEMKSADVETILHALWTIDDAAGVVVLS